MKRKKASQWIFRGIVFVVILQQPILAQITGRGVVRGVVRDPNQLVVPAADVRIVNQSTNVTLATVTSEVGAYFFGAVPIGQYKMTVQMPGFNTWTTQFSLQVGSTVAVDAVLQVGDIATTIEVLDTVSEVSIDRLEIANVKDFDRIQQLPLNGRNITGLFYLTPGVEFNDAFKGSAALQPRVLGMEIGSAEITLDGVSLVNRWYGGMDEAQPGLDIVQEFRIETVGSDARFSRPATITLASRSGTNELHGSVFWTHRNNGFGLRARRREEFEEPSRLIRNEFGGTAGGPFRLGDFYDGRDKTFWFFSYEGLRTRSSSPTNSKVPMEEWWDGDFRQLVEGQDPVTLYDPWTTRADGTRDPFPGNQIPRERFHPMAGVLESVTAKPNQNVNPGIGDKSYNFIYFYPLIHDSNKYTARVDQVLSENDNLSARWTHSIRKSRRTGGAGANPPPDNLDQGGPGSTRQDHPVTNVSVNWNRAWSPSLLNEFLVGVNRTWFSAGSISDSEKWADKMGLPNPFDASGWPQVNASTTPGAFWRGEGDLDYPQTHTQLEDNLTWVKGNHVLQLGGKLRVEHNNIRRLAGEQGSNRFDRSWTGLYEDGQSVSRTGTGLASALLGLGTLHSATYNRGYFYFRQNEFGLYVNDKWKVKPNLTINLGLRWDAWTPYREKQDKLVVVDTQTFDEKFEVVTPHSTAMESIPGIPSGALKSWAARDLTWTTADAIGYPGSLFKADWNNFGPRIGISYMLNPKTVIRGSYGEYFWADPLVRITDDNAWIPPLYLNFTNEPNFKPSEIDPNGTNAIYTWTNPPADTDFVDQIVIDTEGIVEISPLAQYLVMTDGRNWRDGHARSWHVTLEREVMRNTALRFSYTGTMGRDLQQFRLLSRPETEFNYVTRTGKAYPTGLAREQLRRNPDWSGFFLTRRGYSNTHSGQAEIERRFSEGIGFQAFYIYTRTLNTFGDGTWGTFYPPNFTQLYQYPNPVGDYFTSEPSDDELLRMSYLNSGQIPAHRIRFNGIVDLPFGRGKRLGSDVSGALNQVIGGWQVAFIGDWRSGFYRTIDMSRGVFEDYTIEPGDRPVVEIFGNTQKLWFAGDGFNPSSCTGGDCEALENFVPADRSQRAIHPYHSIDPKNGKDTYDNRVYVELADGTIRRTDVLSGHFWPFAKQNFMGPRYWNVDLSIFKHFYLTEDVNLRFTADFFNFFNHPNDPNPDSTTGLVNLGQSAAEPRTIQLSLRLNW